MKSTSHCVMTLVGRSKSYDGKIEEKVFKKVVPAMENLDVAEKYLIRQALRWKTFELLEEYECYIDIIKDDQ